MAAGQDAGELRDEGSAAGNAEETVGVDNEPGRVLEAIEVADLALVTALAEELGSLAMGAAFWPPQPGLKLDMDGGWGRLVALEGVITLQAYIQVKKHRGHDGSNASCPQSLMKSPFLPVHSFMLAAT